MTDDTLRKECEAFAKQVDTTIADSLVTGEKFDLDDLTGMILAFARAQQAKGLREAARHLLIDPDNVCDWTKGAREVADDMSNYLEAQATALENKK